MIWKVFAVLFALFLLMVAMLANLGLAGSIFGPIYAFPNGDKIAHFILYGILGLLFSLGFSPGRARLFGLRPLRITLVLVIIATLEEISQNAFDNRSFDLLDLSTTLAGIILFSELGDWFKRAGKPEDPETHPEP
jgi:hypothetical protein